MPVARGTQPLTQGAEPLTKDTQTLAPNTLPRPNSTKLVAARHTWTAAASSAPPTSPQRAQQQQEGGPRAPEWKGGPGGPLHEQGCEVQPLMCVMGKDSCMIERGRQVSRREEPLHGEEDLEQAGRGMRMSMDEKKNLLTPRANGHWDPTCSQKQSLRANTLLNTRIRALASYLCAACPVRAAAWWPCAASPSNCKQRDDSAE
eukprot:scaffold10054_cov20-Tisochrysis_lutea.AAC.3